MDDTTFASARIQFLPNARVVAVQARTQDDRPHVKFDLPFLLTEINGAGSQTSRRPCTCLFRNRCSFLSMTAYWARLEERGKRWPCARSDLFVLTGDLLGHFVSHTRTPCTFRLHVARMQFDPDLEIARLASTAITSASVSTSMFRCRPTSTI